jgi:DNA sulfur modification protein DndD
MSAIIKKIELSNWFGYYGSYEGNQFEFSDGVNIIVAANEVGKSKLHNAFRWVLTDNVILKIGNNYEESDFNSSTAKDIFNKERFDNLPNESTDIVGVKLTVEITKSNGDKLRRILVKEIVCRKDVNEIHISEIKKKVFRTELGAITSAPEPFDSIADLVIKSNLRNFFLVQGESYENLTPLRGEQLRVTINNLFNLNILDRHCDRSIQFISNTRTLRQGIEAIETRAKGDFTTLTNSKIEKENRINEINSILLPPLNELNALHTEKVTEYRAQALLAKEQKKISERLEKYIADIATVDGKIIQQYRTVVENCINKDFWISKFTDYSSEYNSILATKEKIRDYAADRSIELDDKLTDQERNMLFKLERDQPRPSILKEMVDDNICYVCSNELSVQSKIYIQEKLIPFFKKELNNNDSELNKLNELHDLFKQFDLNLNRYLDADLEYIESFIDDLIALEESRTSVLDDKENFINENGVVTSSDVDSVSLHTYDQSISALNSVNDEILNFTNELESLNIELGQIKSKILALNPEEEESDKLKKSRKLEEFSLAFKDALIEIKREAYATFATELEVISNNKFKAFSSANINFRDQKLVIDFKLLPNNHPDFEVKIINKYGHNMTQGGGASQILRQLSLIFGLIEKSEGSVDYPFIADAPTSDMTPVLAKHFFEYQLENSNHQNILITKDLWDDDKNELNEIGVCILNKANSITNSSLVTIVPKKSTNSRFEISKLK